MNGTGSIKGLGTLGASRALREAKETGRPAIRAKYPSYTWPQSKVNDFKEVAAAAGSAPRDSVLWLFWCGSFY